LERLCRQDRRRTASSAASITCPSCRGRCDVSDIPGFDGVDVLPVPRRLVFEGRNAPISLHEYLQRQPGALEPRVTHVLVTLVEDILRLRFPPFTVPTGWADYVEHVRRLPPREIFDTVWLPLLCREETVRDDLLAWGDELHHSEQQGPLPPFPWPLQGTSTPPPSPPPSSDLSAGSDVARDGVRPCVRCGRPVGEVGGITLPCSRGTHAMHNTCAEQEARLSRRDVNGVVLLPCPRCHEEFDIVHIDAFAGTDPRPVPARAFEWDDDVTTMWEENETLEAFILERTSAGLPHYDLLLDLWADVWGDRWPPYAPPDGASASTRIGRPPETGRDETWTRRSTCWSCGAAGGLGRLGSGRRR
ncbi:unnamed protein product, partial [Ectocarpus sp. 12 AP-2014]